MKDNELREFVELLYPFFKEKLMNDGTLQKYTQIKTATVVSNLSSDSTNINEEVDVILPYDSTSFTVINKTGEDLNQGDVVSLLYWIDLKNAVAIFKAKK